jgi:hypothetical protein
MFSRRIPFSESQDDDSRNGIALAPTFRRALDRYLIAPGPDLKWHVSPVLDSRIPAITPNFWNFTERRFFCLEIENTGRSKSRWNGVWDG